VGRDGRALISAVSFELAQEGVKEGAAAVGAGLALGALTYYGASGWIARREGDSGVGTALALGAFLDGIPEQPASRLLTTWPARRWAWSTASRPAPSS
jgi:zinc transporter, ZIP family